MTYYSYASTNEVTVRLLDEDDSVATITGGGWWDGRFYVAITVGDCRETVVYSIDEPEMTTSIEDDTARNARGSGRTTSITLNASTFGSWLQRNAAEAVVYDVHGRLVDHRVVTSGVFLVISSENIHLVAVVD